MLGIPYCLENLYVEGVRMSQETRLWAFTACYGDRFTFLYMQMMFVLQRRHTYGPPRSVTEIPLHFYTQIILGPH
jgi:hypothetical protein